MSEMLAGDFIDDMKALRSKGMTVIYLASQFGLRASQLKRYLDWGRVPKWLLQRYADQKERLFEEAKDSEIADLRDFITRLAHYMAARERCDVNWRFPFNRFPEPEEKHTKQAEDIGRTGSTPALALALLKQDFHIKRLASYKMFHSMYRVRDFNIPNWPGLWGWLDLWCHALKSTVNGRKFLHEYARLTWRWLNQGRRVTDERQDIFERIDRIHGESDAVEEVATVPDWYVERKSNSVLEALRSGRRQASGFKLAYNPKNKAR